MKNKAQHESQDKVKEVKIFGLLPEKVKVLFCTRPGRVKDVRYNLQASDYKNREDRIAHYDKDEIISAKEAKKVRKRQEKQKANGKWIFSQIHQ